MPRMLRGIMDTDSIRTIPISVDRALEQSRVPVSSATVRRALAAGRIVGVRVGRRWLTTPDAIVAAMVRQVGPSSPTPAAIGGSL